MKKIALVLTILFTAAVAYSQVTLPQVSLGLQETEDPKQIVSALRIIVLLTVLTLAPAILILMTSFTRIIIVLSLLRQALGTMQMPPNQLLVGLSLFLTFFIMSPVLTEVHEQALKPFVDGKMDQETAINTGLAPVRRFMFSQTRGSDLSLFVKMAEIKAPETRADVPTNVLIPAFILSELKTAFQIGFIIFLPFLVIDMVTASVLMAMGMMMLPPVVVSLPFKIMLFVLVDGWSLLLGSMVESFG